MSGAVAVFVKTPGVSPVKTRLAVKLGTKTAEAFHLASAQSISSVVRQLSMQTDVVGYYAVAEQSALEHRYWRDLPCLWQGEGGLGERMAEIYHRLLEEHDFVILVGADIPQMTVGDLLVATNWLVGADHARLVFAPSADGGFWAFGGNCNVAQNIWTDILYGKADTGAQFFKKVENLGQMKIMPTLMDVDEVSDLLSLRDDLLSLSNGLPEQSELIRFLDLLPANFPD